jgi:hypothetical protein
MTAIHSSVPPHTSFPNKSGRGCLWGCLAVLAFLFLPLLLALGYGGWFFYQGYAHDPVLRGVVELVRRDGMAEAALGENIHITGVEGSALSYMWGSGEAGSYVVALAGSKGEGRLHLTARSDKGHLTIQNMMLDGPGGSHYDLLHHIAQPGQNPTDSI